MNYMFILLQNLLIHIYIIFMFYLYSTLRHGTLVHVVREYFLKQPFYNLFFRYLVYV